MSREVVRATIRGIEFAVTPLPASKGFVVGRRVLKALSPVFELANVVSDENALKLEIFKRIPVLAESISDDDFRFVYEAFCASTVAETSDDKTLSGKQLDDLFAVNYLTMGEWLKFCVVSNFADLLSALGNRAAPGVSRTEIARP